jgi:hypothetical protein
VKHAAAIEQLRIKLQAQAFARQCSEIENTAGVVEEQGRGGIADILGDFTCQLAVGYFYTGDIQCHEDAPGE